MKTVLAWAIIGAINAVAITVIGAAIRGPYADKSLTKDALTGATVVGGAVAVKWAMGEVGHDAADV